MNRGSELAEDLMLEILPTLEIPAEVAAEAAHPPRAPKGSQGQHTQPWETLQREEGSVGSAIGTPTPAESD
jgi:hypothetical protein